MTSKMKPPRDANPHPQQSMIDKLRAGIGGSGPVGLPRPGRPERGLSVQDYFAKKMRRGESGRFHLHHIATSWRE
jgi:hypothetical protein